MGLVALRGDPAAMPVLYRSFGESRHAQALVEGRVRITTIVQCRKIEDALRRDEDEGKITYKSGFASEDSSDPQVAEVFRRSGFVIENCTDITISDCTNESMVPDGLVICMSRERKDKFGPYCVRIDRPVEMFEAVSEALENAGHIKRDRSLSGVITRVTYRAREYQGLDAKPLHPGFIKTKRFEDEREVRMLWPLDCKGPDPFELVCDRVRHYCTRIS